MTAPAWTYPGVARREQRGSVRGAYRTRFWRLAIGGLGLFWVFVALWLVAPLIA